MSRYGSIMILREMHIELFYTIVSRYGSILILRKLLTKLFLRISESIYQDFTGNTHVSSTYTSFEFKNILVTSQIGGTSLNYTLDLDPSNHGTCQYIHRVLYMRILR